MIGNMPDAPTLAPSLLLSMPQLDDPNFARSVVLLCQHDTDGAFGLVLNRPVTTTAKIVPQAEPEAATEQEIEVWIGGPVEPERSWILLSDPGLDENAVKVCDGVYLSTSARVLQHVIVDPDQSRARLIAGYAGWGPGQLDEEVAASAWLTGDIDLDIVFHTPPAEMWERAIRRLGAEPGSLQLGSGVH
jgi:putative transcriptional regulator